MIPPIFVQKFPRCIRRRTDKIGLFLYQVGLNSKLIHSQFYLVPGGSLQLVRRCESNSCQGHCVCAAEDLKCTLDEAIDCVDMRGGMYHYLTTTQQ